MCIISWRDFDGFWGEYSHSVRKIAKEGDFRVQDDHGGRVEKHIQA